jgi:hypothetical protein
MRCWTLSEKPVQTIIEVGPNEFLLQTADQTRLVARDLGDLSERLTESTPDVASQGVHLARRALRDALAVATYREEHLPRL